jgi:hypothetical protein
MMRTPASTGGSRRRTTATAVWIAVFLAAGLLAWQLLGAATLPLATGLIGAAVELRYFAAPGRRSPWRGVAGGILGAAVGGAALSVAGSLIAVGHFLFRAVLLGVAAVVLLRLGRWAAALRGR